MRVDRLQRLRPGERPAVAEIRRQLNHEIVHRQDQRLMLGVVFAV
jgi:hypothetical protein